VPIRLNQIVRSGIEPREHRQDACQDCARRLVAIDVVSVIIFVVGSESCFLTPTLPIGCCICEGV